VSAEPGILAELLTSFFVRHLAVERDASRHTITSYRDTFRLLLRYSVIASGKPASKMTMDDLAPDTILAFLEHLEHERGNSIRCRNARLAAIRSFFSYAMTREPSVAALAQKVVAIPFKQTAHRILGHLDEDELRAILASPNRKTPGGRRDYFVLSLLYDTGARVQELVDLRPRDFRLDGVPLVHITGKGRRERIVPLMPATASLVRQHLEETRRSLDDAEALLRNYRGEPLTPSGVTYVLDKYRRRAAAHRRSLDRKGISPHTMRHTKAMHLLQAGVAPITLKDILGHADLKTLSVYVQADLDMKRKALETAGTPVRAGRRLPRRDPDLLAWLEAL
jgi:site-specific recombinase XerD